MSCTTAPPDLPNFGKTHHRGPDVRHFFADGYLEETLGNANETAFNAVGLFQSITTPGFQGHQFHQAPVKALQRSVSV